MQSLDEQVLDALADASGIAILVVFGSRAAGTARPGSDLDVAVLPASDDPAVRRRLQWRIASDLADLVPQGRVDVIFLDEAPCLLRQRIMENGRMVVCTNAHRWRELRVRTMREFADHEPARATLRRAQHKRLQGGTSSGRSGRALRSFEQTGRLSR